MDSMLVKLKLDTERFKAGQVVEIFKMARDSTDSTDSVTIVIKSLHTIDEVESIEISENSFSDYFEMDKGLSKVYGEYHSKVITDLLNNSRETSKYLIVCSVVIMIISLAIICYASTVGGRLGVIVSLLNIMLTLTGLCIIHKKSKQSKSTNNDNIKNCRNTRRQELVHMLTNLGYIDSK